MNYHRVSGKSYGMCFSEKSSKNCLIFKHHLYRCGSFLENIQETHLFLSAGGGKTMLHRDPYSSIHCIFNGTKQWLTIHPSQTHLLYQSEESRFEYGGFSEVDVDHVDLEDFPMISDVKYSKIAMVKGDCLFMPQGSQYKLFNQYIWFSLKI